MASLAAASWRAKLELSATTHNGLGQLDFLLGPGRRPNQSALWRQTSLARGVRSAKVRRNDQLLTRSNNRRNAADASDPIGGKLPIAIACLRCGSAMHLISLHIFSRRRADRLARMLLFAQVQTGSSLRAPKACPGRSDRTQTLALQKSQQNRTLMLSVKWWRESRPCE